MKHLMKTFLLLAILSFAVNAVAQDASKRPPASQQP
jgi:hypothetical protein